MRKSSLRRLLAPIALLAALLGGCATPGPSLVGADAAAVTTKQGAPPERYPLAGGGERWIYPLGGLQQYVWAVDFNAGGRVSEVRQVRTGENFGRVRVGTDTEADIRREFGPPRLIVPYSRVGLVAWMFPYKEQDIWNSEMAIYFDPQGIVRRIENGPDPRFLGGNDNRHN
jgi:hypothetical protein